jgi:hypothetical protein
MDLLSLAPDIQEDILFLPRVSSGRDEITERRLRLLTATTDWAKQRRLWQNVSKENKEPTESVS